MLGAPGVWLWVKLLSVTLPSVANKLLGSNILAFVQFVVIPCLGVLFNTPTTVILTGCISCGCLGTVRVRFIRTFCSPISLLLSYHWWLSV